MIKASAREEAKRKARGETKKNECICGMKIENDLGRDPIRKLVYRIGLPSMLAQFVSVLYSIVDRMYIGNLGGIGDLALAGVGICGPIVTMIGSVAFFVGVGGSPLMSIALGEQKEKKAEQILANSFFLLLVFSVFLTAGSLWGKEALLRWFGASDAIFPYANEYITVYLCGTVFSLLSIGMNQFIICQGFARVGMVSVLLGAVTNIILDPVLMFGFDMGVFGAALATVISQMLSCFYVLEFLLGKKPAVRIRWGGYRFDIMGQILKTGFTPFAIIAVDNVMIIAMNALLQRYGGPQRGDMLITCATIVQSLMLVVTMPLGGISAGTQTILGFNYGARRADRVRQAQHEIRRFAVIFASLMFFAAMVFARPFAMIFTQKQALLDLTERMIRIYVLGVIPLGVQYTIVDGFTGMGLVRLSMPLSFFRKGVFFAALFLLPRFFGAEGLFFAESISDFLGTGFSVLVYRLNMESILTERCGSQPGGV